MCQNRIVTIFRKRVVKQAIGGAKGNSEIVAIPNKYKDTLDDLIDSSDVKSLDRLRPIDKGSHNAPKSEGSPMGLLEGDRLNKDVSDRSSWLAPKTEDSKVHQHHDVAPLGLKSGGSRYRKV